MGFEELAKKLRYLDNLYDELRASSLYRSDKDKIARSVDAARRRYELAIIESGDYPTF